MPRLHLFIAGRVQGVFYRENLRREADAIAVRGWARNLSDGRVEVVLEGPRDALDEALAWCRRGPPAARVTGVDVREEPEEGLVGFAVRESARVPVH